MKIRYLGHSCFVLTESTGTTIVTDPYGAVGFRLPDVAADAVTVSHGHYDKKSYFCDRQNCNYSPES